MSHAHNKTTANEQVGPVNVTKGADPSNTHSIQRAFVRDILRRFRRIRGLIRQTVGYENDALQLRANDESDPVEVFDFPTDTGKVRAFIRQLKEWLQNEVVELNDPIQVQNGEHWTAEYLQNAYVTGVQTAQGRLMSEGMSFTADDREAIVSRPTSVRQLQQIYTRAYENLTDITEDMANTIRNELTDAIRDGENPRKVATRLNNKIQSLTNTRATTLARTEIINSHSDAALNTYEEADAEVVSHVGRMTAKDARVCGFCRALEDVPFTLSEFQTVTVRWGSQIMRVGVPAHPQGRCSPVPKLDISAGDLAPLEKRIPDTIRGKQVSILTR